MQVLPVVQFFAELVLEPQFSVTSESGRKFHFFAINTCFSSPQQFLSSAPRLREKKSRNSTLIGQSSMTESPMTYYKPDSLESTCPILEGQHIHRQQKQRRRQQLEKRTTNAKQQSSYASQMASSVQNKIKPFYSKKWNFKLIENSHTFEQKFLTF